VACRPTSHHHRTSHQGRLWLGSASMVSFFLKIPITRAPTPVYLGQEGDRGGCRGVSLLRASSMDGRNGGGCAQQGRRETWSITNTRLAAADATSTVLSAFGPVPAGLPPLRAQPPYLSRSCCSWGPRTGARSGSDWIVLTSSKPDGAGKGMRSGQPSGIVTGQWRAKAHQCRTAFPCAVTRKGIKGQCPFLPSPFSRIASTHVSAASAWPSCA
jgi:hypothetical protein